MVDEPIHLRSFCFVHFHIDDTDFLPSLWNGTYVCSDDNRNLSYVLNVTKSDSNIGTVATLIIDRHSLPMEGTFASFGQLLAIQGRQLLSQLVYGNNFTNVEIDMKFNTSLYMVGAIVFTANGGLKTCTSELRRAAGMCTILRKLLMIIQR